MIRLLVAVFVSAGLVSTGYAQTESASQIESRLKDYIAAFNQHDAAMVAKFWTADAVSVDETTGSEVAGRDAIAADLANLFKENSELRLVGDVGSIRLIKPDVATVDGTTTLFVDDGDAVESQFSAVLVKTDEGWMIASSREHDIAAPANASQALESLDWLVGTWKDKTDAANVTTTFRWTPNRSFLLRSFTASFAEGDSLEGTQVIGWDAAAQQIRAWTFSSDGSFAEGVVSETDAGMMLKSTHTLATGQLGSSTKLMTRVDDNTIQVETVSETVAGIPVALAEPVTVVRVDEADANTSKTEN